MTGGCDELVFAIADDMGVKPENLVAWWGEHPFNRISSVFKLKDLNGDLKRFKDYSYFREFLGDWYAYPNIDQVILKSRQIGISTGAQLGAVDTCIAYSGINVPVVSNQGKNSGKFVQDLGDIIRTSPYFDLLPVTEHGLMKERIEFTNGSVIQAYSSNPDSLRSGPSFVTILDEFAFLPEQERMLKAVAAKHSRGGSIKMISTPLATDDQFMDWFTKAKNGLSTKKFYFYPLFDPALLDPNKSILEQPQLVPICEDIDLERVEQVRLDSVEGFLQEYMCVPLDDSTAYYKTDLIMACWDDDMCERMRLEALDLKNRAGSCYIGIDVAIQRDETAIVVIYVVNGQHFVIDMTRTQADFNEQIRIMARYIDLYQPSAVRCDKTDTLGKAIERDLRRRYANLIEGVQYTNAEKEDMAVRLKRYMQNTLNGFTPSLKIPSSRDLLTQIHGIKITITIVGNKQFSGKGEQGLDDLTNALWLSLPPITYRRLASPATAPGGGTRLSQTLAQKARLEQRIGRDGVVTVAQVTSRARHPPRGQYKAPTRPHR